MKMETHSKKMQQHERAMETETIQKNEASLKSRMSKGKIKLFVTTHHAINHPSS